MSKIFLTLLLLTGVSLGCHAQTVLSQELKDNIRQRVEKGLNQGIVVGVIDAGGVQYYSYGVRSLSGKEPVDEHAVFEIGSITKTFTGIVLADMVLKGKVKLDDPLQQYLPEGVKAPMRNGESIKLVHLSNHTSSLPRMPNNFNPANPANPFADYSEKQMYNFLQSYTLPRDIGSQYEYSNYAAGLLGHVLASKKGTPYEALMVDVIAKPLGLQDTRITLTANMKDRLAMGHHQGTQVENWDIPTLAGAGAIRSTAVDLLRYVGANMGMVKSKLYPAMQLSHKNSRTAGASPIVGLGWHTTVYPDAEIIWHNGGTGGYRSFAGFTSKGDKGVVVLTNSTASIDDIGIHLLNPKAPLTVANPTPVSTPAEAITVDPQILQSYVGMYELAPGFILTVTREDSQLKVRATGQAQFPIHAKTQNVFYLTVVEAQLTFNQNAEGKVESVTLHQGGRDLVGKKMN